MGKKNNLSKFRLAISNYVKCVAHVAAFTTSIQKSFVGHWSFGKIKYYCVVVQLNRAMVCGLYLQAIWKCLKPWSKVPARETREEAEAEIEIEQLYCMYNIPRIR